jgi:DNA-binding transcriptional MerR regulator
VDPVDHSVGEVARLGRTSVRTLHHYDRIGLLSPSSRTPAGYRLYSDADLERLQEVLFYRELEVPLREIARIMADPAHDRRASLSAQRELLATRAARTRSMVGAIDRALAALDEGKMMDEEEMFEVFGDFDPADHEDEARRRWGGTDAYKESARRTARYGKEDWLRIRAEGEAIEADFVRLMTDGAAADSPEALAVAERHRLQIGRWFYPLSHEMHAALAAMYVADPRFAEHYEKRAGGLARFVHDAIVANAAGRD